MGKPWNPYTCTLNKEGILKLNKNEERKKRIIKKAAAGDAETMYLLAQDYENEGNFDNAFFWYNKAAMQGLADGINNVAMYYLEGLVVTPDVDKTINLLESIAD